MPTVAEALQLAWGRHQAGDLAAAEQMYRQVLRVAPANENAWCFLGMACHDQARYGQAVEAYRQALRMKPDFPVALNNLGNTLKQQGKLDEAVASCREALRYKPDYGTAYNNLGVAQVAQGKLREAAANFQKAIERVPRDAVARTNLGAALVRQGRFDEGIAVAEQALQINPSHAEAHKNLGIVWLLLGDFQRGWPEYEWRWKCPGCRLPNSSQPRWDGSPLAGRTMLLYAEQGLGDTIHFVRYAPWLKAQGARVIVACQNPLVRLLASCDGIDQLVPQGTELPPHDVHSPLLSLPGILRTTEQTIPSHVPYLAANPSLVDRWRQRLAACPGYRIGIAWQGSPDFHADRQRSFALACFAPLAKLPSVRLISLQKDNGVEQLRRLQPAFEVLDVGDDLDTDSGPFMDTAAIMKNLDLVVTSDTSIAHLAGALAVPVWVALSVSPDWRWLLDRPDTPWYPTMRLFRQEQLDDWEGVFERITAEVQRKLPPPPVVSVPSRRIAACGFNCLSKTRHGLMLYNRNDMYIGRSLDLYGEYSEAEITLLRQLVRSGDLIVDVGANIGAIALPLAKLVGHRGVVFAFEPQRVVFQTLCANISLNSLTNVHCRHEAVGAARGEIVVPRLDYSSENNFGGLGLGEYSQGERVPLVTLDNLELPSCRLLKIDVEGMERQVLEGAVETIRRCHPFLYVENDRQERSAALIESITAMEYRLFWHRPPLFNPANFFQDTDNVFGVLVSANMLGVPAGSAFAFPGLEPLEG